MSTTPPATRPGSRVQRLADGADLSGVASVLMTWRDEVLQGWLVATREQPFHQARPEHAVADHIPALYDAVVTLLRREASPQANTSAPMDDPAVLHAAHEHARTRFEQGLQADDIVTEFRLLRQETGSALRRHLHVDTRACDLMGGQLLLHDALDGAMCVAVAALANRVEEVREDFLATSMHDVRQPMATIKLSLQYALRLLTLPQPEPAPAADALRRAESETTRMVTLLTTLAEASRIALGRLEPHVARSDLAELVRGAVARFDPQSAGRIRLDIPAGADTTGDWDAAMLDRVIGNLLSNAVKYSPHDAPIDVTLRAEPHHVWLVVRDRGIGMDAVELQGIFERYSRAQGALEQGVEGQGLGLYLCRGIVQAHGGRIWAESPGRGQGTTFNVVLPRRAPPLPPAR
jgi:signal transduction histidine kinase